MSKQNIGKAFDICPMPVVIVGTVTNGRPNFMTASWVTKVNSAPPLIGLSLGHEQHTAVGIQQTGQFSISFPNIDQAVLADYCGLVSGRDVDKAARIDIFLGELESAPMVRACPLALECHLSQTVDLPDDYLFIGEVINVYADESVLTSGKVDLTKLSPFVLTMPGETYWALGERVGEAWKIGKVFLET